MARIVNDFERCVKERHLIKIKATSEMIEKEITSAKYDLERSKESLKDEDYKWASVQAYIRYAQLFLVAAKKLL